MFRIIMISGVLGLCLGSQSLAQPGSDPGENQRVAQAQRREWVRSQLTKLIANPQDRAEVLKRLNDLSDDQIQVVASICLDELESRRRSQFKALRAANQRERELQEQRQQEFQEQLLSQIPPSPAFYAPPGIYPPPGIYSPTVGFIPVITWLPEGASLSAQAVVSGDGRHVRMSLAPFFSTIGPVYTFNYMTGETRRYDQ